MPCPPETTTLLTGMTISQTAEIIAEILHGVSFGGPAGVHWRRIEAQAASDVPRMIVSRT